MISFYVPGAPVTQGSKTIVGRGYGARMVERANMRTTRLPANRLKDWREAVAAVARKSFSEAASGMIRIDVVFAFDRPKSHYNKSGSVKKGALIAPKLDLDKLQRAIGDALTFIAYDDDAQICEWRAVKRWAIDTESAGAYVTVYTEEWK